MTQAVMPTLAAPPEPQQAEMLRALAGLFHAADIVELRVIHKAGRKRVDSGYFDHAHWPELVAHAERLNRQGAAAYITLNPVDPQLLGCYHNRMQEFAGQTTGDKEIVRRRWLLVDLDPVRPAGTSATGAQVEAASQTAGKIFRDLKTRGWPSPLVARSGNGMHLLFAIDLPNDAGAQTLLRGVLGGLAILFDGDGIKVDQAVHNAARICKLYGTTAMKGDHSAAAPWRLSEVLYLPPERRVVTAEQLREIALPAMTSASGQTPATMPRAVAANQPGEFDIETFLARHGIAYAASSRDGRDLFKLTHCPFNPEHVDGEAAAFRFADGRLGFKCQHDSCSNKHWRDVRELLDGPHVYAAGSPLNGIDIAACQAAAALRNVAGADGAGLVNVDRVGEAGAAPASDMLGETEDEIANLSHAPKFDYACVPGVLGRFIASETACSEAPPVGILANLVTRLCADIGRSAYVTVGRQRLHMRMFWLCAGPSALGRKGTAAGIARDLRDAAFARQPVDDLERMNPAREMRALSTGEGLIASLRTTARPEDGPGGPPGLADNRVLVDAQEFAGVLHKASGPQSTLSPVLRDGYDGGTLQNASASNASAAEKPHINVNASVPDQELVALLSGESSVERDNGLLNRFVLTWQRREKIVADPKPGAPFTWDEMADAYSLALRTAWGGVRYAVALENVVELSFAPDAQQFLTDWYLEEQARVDAPKVQSLLLRQGNVLRVYACLLALLRGCRVVETTDLQAGVALLLYWRNSLEFLFTQGRETAAAHRMYADMDRVLSHMPLGIPVAVTHLKDVLTLARRTAAINFAQRLSPPTISLTRIPRVRGGRAKTELTRLM